MERTTFLDYYRICANREGIPHELGRTGAVITYKAVDERTGETVALKLIPMASIDPAAREQFEQNARAAERINHVNIAKVFDFGHEEDRFVYVSEFLQGEPLASWVEERGPMPADAALRVAEQIVSVLSTASFHKLTHCAIQPSNLMIVPGSTPEGGWPFVKLMNFGLAGLKIGSDGPGESEGSFSVAPPFAGPEQLQHATVDFRSEVYSLGATMYFLLTGSAPPADLRRQQLGAFPKALRNLLGNMLHHNPDQRPKDPVTLEEMIRECMVRIERRRALAQRLGIPLAAVIPRKPKTPSTPFAQVLRGILAFAALVFAAGVLATFFLPDDLNPFRHRTVAKQVIGVPIGVPETSPTPVVQNASTAVAPATVLSQAANTALAFANQLGASGSTASNSPQVASPDLQQAEPSNAQPEAAATPVSSPSAIPESSAEGEAKSSAQANAAAQPATASQSSSRSKKKRVASTSPRRTGSMRSRVVGITSDGRLIFRLPSGRTAIVAPDSDEDQFVPRRHRRAFIERDETFVPRSRFESDDFPYD